MAKHKKHISKIDAVKNDINWSGITNHLKYLIGLSIVFKFALVILTTMVLGSFLDYYTVNYYYEHALTNLNGSYTYISYYYEYPILSFVPVVVALIPSLLLNSVSIFNITFSVLMIMCDCIAVSCIYLISRKIWNDSKKAFISALIYLTAISTAYFVMIDYGILPSCMLLISLTTLFYGKELFGRFAVNEYISIIIGYFLKVFPIVALPFVALYKSRTTSLKEEIISIIKVGLPITLILVLPTLIFNPLSTLKTYLPARMDIGYFPNTIIWTSYVWLHDIFKLGLTMENVLVGVYICMIAGFIFLFYSAFKYQKQDPIMLVKFILCGIMLIVLSFKVRSPSYILWFTPLVCILIGDDIYKIGLFYITQILAYIEFPLTFWSLWTNIEYTNPIYSFNWYMALTLFTLEFGTLLLLVWMVLDPIKMYKQIYKND